jgi:AraC-like DNA-binding protein
LIFETHTIEKPLVNQIESIFYYKGFKPDHSIERVVPTGHVFIIFELDGFEYYTFDKKSLKPNGAYKNVWISGMHKDFLSISAHQDSEMLVIQFKTGGSYPFLKIPIHQLNNKVIDAKELFGDEILELREQILKVDSVLEKFKLVEGWLMHKFDINKTPDIDVLDILSKLKANPITESSTIIKSYSNTQKHLINQFKTYFGLTPKVFHRIFRFNEILRQIQNEKQLIWSQIAYEFGYSDQSHFIKEFREFSGFNPQEFIKSDYHKDDETNFFPLDRKG